MATKEKSCVKVIYTTKDGKRASIIGFFLRTTKKHRVVLKAMKRVVWSLSGKVYEIVDFTPAEKKIAFDAIKNVFAINPIPFATEAWDDGC